MNLYKILVEHFSVKDSKKSIVCLLLADNDEQCYDWLKQENQTKELTVYPPCYDGESEQEIVDVYDENYEVVRTETKKEYFIRIQGEINDDNFENNDAYYGNTIFGWELLKENVTSDYTEMKELGIVREYKRIIVSN